MSAEELKVLQIKYDSFLEGYKTHKLSSHWNCFVRCFRDRIFFLATTEIVVKTMSSLVQHTLYQGCPFEKYVRFCLDDINEYKAEVISQNIDVFRTYALEMANEARVGSTMEKGDNDLVRPQPSSTAIDVDSNSQTDSMEAGCSSSNGFQLGRMEGNCEDDFFLEQLLKGCLKDEGERKMSPLPKFCSMGYKKEVISKDVLQSCRETVEPYFRELGFDFLIWEDRYRLIVQTNGVESQLLIARAKAALSAIACGLSSLWVEVALDQKLYCNDVKFAQLDKMSMEELKGLRKKYVCFFEGFETHKLSALWNCFVLYFANHVLILATTEIVVTALTALVQLTLTQNWPFEKLVCKLMRYIDKYTHEDMSLNVDLFRTYYLELVKEARVGSTMEKGDNDLVRQQPCSTVIDVGSNSQTDSMKAICCSSKEAVPPTHSQVSLYKGLKKSKLESEFKPRCGDVKEERGDLMWRQRKATGSKSKSCFFDNELNSGN